MIKKNYVFLVRTIYVIQAIRMIKYKDEGYLYFISNSEEKTKLSIKETPIVCEYPDFFSREFT